MTDERWADSRAGIRPELLPALRWAKAEIFRIFDAPFAVVFVGFDVSTGRFLGDVRERRDGSQQPIPESAPLSSAAGHAH